MAQDTDTAHEVEDDMQRGIVIRVPSRDADASPAARRNTNVVLVAHDGGRIALPPNGGPHLALALERMWVDEKKATP
jgi:hypothetical protein